jgi:hypothetical protein
VKHALHGLLVRCACCWPCRVALPVYSSSHFQLLYIILSYFIIPNTAAALSCLLVLKFCSDGQVGVTEYYQGVPSTGADWAPIMVRHMPGKN